MGINERAWAEIDLDAMAHNMRLIRQKINPQAKAMAIIKADGYGHGAKMLAPVLLENGADCLGVATFDEAYALRKAGITAHLLLLGYNHPSRFEEVVQLELRQTIFTRQMAEALSQTAVALGKEAYVHIKLDTGMSRLGFMPTDSQLQEVLEISRLPGICLEGLFTHLAQSDGSATDFTMNQAKKFLDFAQKLEDAGVSIPIKHVSNSGAIMNYGDLNMDLVRAGIMLYGLPPDHAMDVKDWNLKRALSFKSCISYMKTVEKDVSIGYSRKYYTKEQSVIATVPVGYADGYSRSLSNKGHVLIGGEIAPIVGNVCMDQFMVDVTHIPHAAIGDEVVLIGVQGDKEITADQLGDWEGTINYEVTCKITKRVPRVYMQNQQVQCVVNHILEN